MNSEEYNWSAELLNKIPTSPEILIAKPIKSISGNWVIENWAATTYIESKHIKNNWKDRLTASRKFHELLKRFAWNAKLQPERHRFSHADSIVWGNSPFKNMFYGNMGEYINKIFSFFEKINCENQIIHSDLCGNTLFTENKIPVIIDFSPAFRPIRYAEAIIICDAIAWEDAPLELMDILDAQDRDQYMLRAINFRLIIAALNEPNRPGIFNSEVKCFESILKKIIPIV
ncbi:MAG: hypothetical protein A3B70_03265 [Deltaproteobacteria bacterium RIFCSPHIGHO2_02_FULL_40_11]|nr:MAG: hypothetical protein A3B70_03265 [Deltaproteobacteria bacterium RIFCSPHIGHO2_02_FULL_40_11]